MTQPDFNANAGVHSSPPACDHDRPLGNQPKAITKSTGVGSRLKNITTPKPTQPTKINDSDHID